MKSLLFGCTACISIIVVVLAVISSLVARTVWWAGYDLENCPNCKPTVDWSLELRFHVGDAEKSSFAKDGAVVLPRVLAVDKVKDLASEVDHHVSNTFMTDALCRTVLRHYLRYEHRLDTRSELIRDWALYGPLGKWAAELLNATEVRLYNAEAIYHKGQDSPTPCSTAWHRDTIAAPFPPDAHSVTFNVYLDDISPDGDGLIYMKGSHKNLDSPPADVTDKKYLMEPTIHVGDVLAHDANIYHTTSGRGCWKRRSLQFRYVAGTPKFSFGPNRFPHGPVPWTLAHAPTIAHHGLKDGDDLQGPWYPRVYPSPIDEEHVPLGTTAWSLLAGLSIAKEAQDIATKQIGIGSKSCVLPSKQAGGDYYDYFGFDGPVTTCDDWEIVNGVPCHKSGQMCKTLKSSFAK